jgi:hypothetical protein
MPGFFPARVIPVAASGQIRNRSVLANLLASSPNTSWGTGLNRMLTSVAVASKMSNASTRSDAMRLLLVRRDEPRRRDHGAAAGERSHHLVRMTPARDPAGRVRAALRRHGRVLQAFTHVALIDAITLDEALNTAARR